MLKLGSKNISKVFLGENRISKAYIGNNLVYHKGDVPSILPEGYTRLEYIENPLGKSAWFSTGIYTSTTINFKIDFVSYDDFASSGFNVIIGGASITDFRDYSLSTRSDEGSGNSGSIVLGDSNYIFNAHLPQKNTRFTAELIGSTYSIGNITQPVTRGAFGNYTIYVFASNIRNLDVRLNSHGRLYSLKMLDGNTTVRNYIPCLNLNDVVGVYDTIGRAFVGSAGRDQFVAGPEYELNM